MTVGAYVLASLPEDGEIPANIGPFLAIVLGLALVAHIAMRRLAPRADGTLLPLATLLAGLGYVFIVRLDEARAEPDGAWPGSSRCGSSSASVPSSAR